MPHAIRDSAPARIRYIPNTYMPYTGSSRFRISVPRIVVPKKEAVTSGAGGGGELLFVRREDGGRTGGRVPACLPARLQLPSRQNEPLTHTPKTLQHTYPSPAPRMGTCISHLHHPVPTCMFTFIPSETEPDPGRQVIWSRNGVRLDDWVRSGWVSAHCRDSRRGRGRIIVGDDV